MLTLYDFLPSGNGYKVRLLLSQLAIPFRLVELDILKGETRTPGRHLQLLGDDQGHRRDEQHGGDVVEQGSDTTAVTTESSASIAHGLPRTRPRDRLTLTDTDGGCQCRCWCGG